MSIESPYRPLAPSHVPPEVDVTTSNEGSASKTHSNKYNKHTKFIKRKRKSIACPLHGCNIVPNFLPIECVLVLFDIHTKCKYLVFYYTKFRKNDVTFVVDF